jgi:hypothetical protein
VYQICYSFGTGKIVSLERPFPGACSDIAIFRKTIGELLLDREQVLDDKAYQDDRVIAPHRGWRYALAREERQDNTRFTESDKLLNHWIHNGIKSNSSKNDFPPLKTTNQMSKQKGQSCQLGADAAALVTDNSSMDRTIMPVHTPQDSREWQASHSRVMEHKVMKPIILMSHDQCRRARG